MSSDVLIPIKLIYVNGTKQTEIANLDFEGFDSEIIEVDGGFTLKLTTDVGSVGLVRDGGADPTGVTDIGGVGGPLDTAAGKLKALSTIAPSGTSLTLSIPPGTFECVSPSTVEDFGAASRDVRIIGSGDATRIKVGVGAGNYMLAWTNTAQLFIEDVAHVGTSTDAGTPDCAAAYYCSPTSKTVFSRCKFIWFLGRDAVVQSNLEGHFDECYFGGNGVLGTGVGRGGVIWSTSGYSQTLRRCTFTDVGSFLDQAEALSKEALSGANVAWFRHDGSFAVGGVQPRIVIEDCYFDENCTHAVIIDGQAGPNTGTIPYVRISGTHFNPPSVGGAAGASIVINSVQELLIEGCVNSGFNTLDSGAAVAMTNVHVARIRGLTTNPGAASNYITADNTVAYLEIENCPGLTPAGGGSVHSTIQSTALRTRVRTIDSTGAGGVWCDLVVISGSGSGAPQMAMKLAADGTYTPMVAGDEAWKMAGVCMTTAFGGNRALLARAGERVTVQNDGVGAIAIGDPIKPSATVNGQLMKATAGTVGLVGVAESAAAAVPGATFTMLINPGVLT